MAAPALLVRSWFHTTARRWRHAPAAAWPPRLSTKA